MEGQPSGLVGGLSIPSGCSIFSVADNGMFLIGEVDTDLVFPAGQKGNFQETEPGGFFQHFISGLREFSFLGVVGGIDDEGLVLGEVGCDYSFFLGEAAVDDREVFLFSFLPFVLESQFNFLTFCEDEDA